MEDKPRIGIRKLKTSKLAHWISSNWKKVRGNSLMQQRAI